MKIGERLVALGMVTQASVDEALGAQMALGARLGTNLVELFDVDIDRLATALGAQHALPAALSAHFGRADPAVQARIPAELAARWHAVPLFADGRGVTVAVSDPLPEEGFEELSHHLEAPLVEAIAPEMRLLFHLEKAYGIERTNRFRRVAAPTARRDDRRHYVSTLSDVELPPEPPGLLARIAVKRVALARTGEHEQADNVGSLEGASRALRRANGRERLADVVISALSDGFGRRLSAGMLLSARRGVLFGWRGFVRDSDRQVIEAVALPLADASLFQTPLAERRVYAGPPPDGGTALDHKLWLLLRTGAPDALAVVPVELRGKVVGVIYAQADAPFDDLLVAGLSDLGDGLAAGFDRLLRGEAR
jgi:hypothetical protein